MTEVNMDLGAIRNQIDDLDKQLLELFIKRMDLCVQVAQYKQANNLPVFQSKREDEVLEKVASNSPEVLADGARLLFGNIMDISKCLQQKVLTAPEDIPSALPKAGGVTVACPGTAGSNTEQACDKLFPKKDIRFYTDFEDVFAAVVNHEADYGVLPIENSSAGEVSQTYRLLAKYDFYICKTTQVSINHCLAAKKGTALSNVKTVYSHEQALAQCSGYIRKAGFASVSDKNTAISAKTVAESEDNTIAAICSKQAAALYGLEILSENIADDPDNTTRFICIGRKPEIESGADIISISVALPHTAGSLYRTLTRFSFYGLNLTKIESAPVPLGSDIKTGAFDVIFYLDFEGSISNPEVLRLMTTLKNEMNYFKFLGNYKHYI